jgi:methyl-accepting chemotaxis protein
MVNEALPLRTALEKATNQFAALEEQRLNEGREQASQAAEAAKTQVIVIALVLIVAAIITAYLLARTLASRIGAAVTDIQSSATELQTTATQQATGAREQSTAMTEITTTMNELLATSKQIAEGAQRVAGISGDAAKAAQLGDRTVRRAHDSVGGIKRQVDTVVTHMLDLGRKSQQIGGIVDVITELSEQTNILAINANIEAAGAGESGRRFAVVADEIRKLADRVGASIKDIRSLIDEVRVAVNTTVMATEGGSKAVDAATRDFGDVTQSLSQIVALIATNADAAREIELSTKQQSTAVEQVNSAVSNVAQVSREVESSTVEALNTASELATLSRQLALLVASKAQA